MVSGLLIFADDLYVGQVNAPGVGRNNSWNMEKGSTKQLSASQLQSISFARELKISVQEKDPGRDDYFGSVWIQPGETKTVQFNNKEGRNYSYTLSVTTGRPSTPRANSR